jgi:autoinducer 2-degrading protein
MYVIAARYLTKEGEEEKVASFLKRRAELSNSAIEPGCVLYAINQSTENPRSFLLYEQYSDEAGFQAHTQTDYFKELVLGGAVPLLERREREIYTLIAP